VRATRVSGRLQPHAEGGRSAGWEGPREGDRATGCGWRQWGLGGEGAVDLRGRGQRAEGMGGGGGG
jgi:hypothetical protein